MKKKLLKKCKRINIFLFISFLFFSGCVNEFDPSEGNTDGIMSFLLFDTRLPVQQLYLANLDSRFSQNNNPGFDIYLSEGGWKMYKFKDTNIVDNKYCHYYIPNFQLIRGYTYRLNTVKDSLLQQWATIYVPRVPMLYGECSRSLNSEGVMDFGAFLYFNIEYHDFYNESSFYYNVQTLVEYEIIKDGKTYTKYSEIPYEISLDKKAVEGEPPFTSYPKSAFYNMESFGFSSDKKKLLPDGSSFFIYENSTVKKLVYKNICVFYAFAFLNETESPSSVTIKKVISICHTCSKDLYEKYLNASDSQLSSFRMDQAPYSSNLSSLKGNGFGFFGAYTVDTLSYKADSSLIKYFGYKDGQK